MRKRKPTLGALVRMVWRDANFEMDAEAPLALVATVGWLTRYDDAVAVVASERINVSVYRAYTTVPRGDVVSIMALDDSD